MNDTKIHSRDKTTRAAQKARCPKHSPEVMMASVVDIAKACLEDADKKRTKVVNRVEDTSKELCVLDTIMINGKPLRDCTAGEARAWARQAAKESKLIKAAFGLD